MCCCNCFCLYRSLPYLYSVTAFLEFIFGIVRVFLFFTVPTPKTQTYTTDSSPTNTSAKHSGQFVVAFIVDWISSIVPTVMGLFVALITIILLLKICLFTLRVTNSKNLSSNSDQKTTGTIRTLLRNKALRRFTTLDCNCPCFRVRPKLRFQLRFVLLSIFFILRLVAITLYAKAANANNNAGGIAIVCSISIIFLFNTFCLDLYRYFVWWHYTPEIDTRCHCRSKKHERYLPYHMIGDNRDSNTLGDRPCTDQPCHERTLDHIAVFHTCDYQPQDRWRDIPKPVLNAESPKNKWFRFSCKEKDEQPHYIGFHTTEPKFAISIAHSEFQSSLKGWLGAGVYFARSIAATEGKHRSTGGARIIAEIRMGKVYEIEQEVIRKGSSRFDAEKYDYVHHSKWHADYDTCYMIHGQHDRDEFAIRDPVSQIIKWVIVIEEQHDPKVKHYQLDTEFDSTQCGCV